MVTRVRFWLRRSSVGENITPAPLGETIVSAAPMATLSDEHTLLRCDACDVTWRGPVTVPCWCCGAPGRIRGEVRILAD